jgi:uncharacterized protein YndB with AHSA1/START domain
VSRSGAEAEWGRVLVWEPPWRLVMNFYPGRTPAGATQVEVTFQAVENGTRLTLTHRGWEQSVPETQARYAGYVTGWDLVLGSYVDQAQKAA